MLRKEPRLLYCRMPLRWRASGAVREYRRFKERFRWLSLETVRECRLERLRALLCHAGEAVEIAGTNLESRAMPLIRCRAGDIGVLTDAPPPCGRTLPALSRLSERTRDPIATPQGMTALTGRGFSFHDASAVKELQILQEEMRRFRLRVVANPGCSSEDGRRLAGGLEKSLGFPITVDVKPADHLPRTERGRLRLVECRVPAPGRGGVAAR